MPDADTPTAELVGHLRRIGTDTVDVEVKAAGGGLPSSITETISAFANGTGGTIILGLSESDAFQPAPNFDAPSIRDALAGACADKMDPPIREAITIETLDGAQIVRMDVPALDPVERPCFITARGAYRGSFIRGGDGDRRLSHYEVTQLLSNRRQPREDEQIVSAASLGDLSPELTNGLIGRARVTTRRAFEDADDPTVLLRLGVIANDDGQLRPTLAGLLCLGRYPQQYFPQLFISFVALPGVEPGDTSPDGRRFLDNQSVNGPLPDMINDAIAAVTRNMRRATTVQGSHRTDTYDYPTEVLRELLSNAVMHRDYSAEALGTQVQIELYPDRLVVKSPGGLWGDVEVGQLGTTGVSSSRNAVLAKLLSEVPGRDGDPVSENRGSGLPRVMRLLRDAGMSPPEFDAAPGHLFVTVPQHALLGAETIEWIGSLPARDLTDTQHLALAMIRSNGSVSNEMLRAWGVESHAATLALTDLVSRGLLVKAGGRRYASYTLNPNEAERSTPNPVIRRNPDETAVPASNALDTQYAAVIEAIRAGHVTTRGIAEQLGIGYHTASRRVRHLRDTGQIAETATRNSSAQSYRIANPG